MPQFHPIIEQWFRSRFNAPTEPQRLGWPAIAAGEHTLIAAPTGSGKTLTAFLAVIDRLLKRSLKAKLSDGIRVVYVSPLRALSNDMHRNLELPLREITELVEQSGLRTIHGDKPTPITVGLRTGDSTSSQRASLVRKPPHILVTTPESLYLLLTSPKGRAALQKTETVIVDEIHALVRDKRGSHLALSLERLQALCKKPLQRIGLSATQRPIERMAEFLVGKAEGRGRKVECNESQSTARADQLALPFESTVDETTDDLDPAVPDSSLPCTIIDVGHSRYLDLAIEVPQLELGAVCSHEHWAEINTRVVELINSHRSTLIFVNTRRLAERVAHQLTEMLGEDAISCHHGSLSFDMRLKAERRLKAGELKAIVATASLELGIDIGYIDLVIQLGSPGSIATFLQRIGRAGHAVAATPKGRLFALTRDELMEGMALMRAIRSGRLDVVPIPEAPLDILAQQIVAEVSAEEEWSSDELFETFRRAYPYRNLTREAFDSVVQIMAEGITDTSGRGRVYLHHDRVKRRLKARPAARIAATMNAGAIPDIGSFRVIADPDGVTVGSVDEDFAVESQRNDIFLLGTTSWRFQGIRGLDVVVTDAGGAPPTIPFWRGEALGRTWELSEEVSRLREDIETKLGERGGVSPKALTLNTNGSMSRNALASGSENPATLEPDASAFRLIPQPELISVVDWLQQETNANEWAAQQIANYVAAQKAAIGLVPNQKRIVFERFFDESGGMQMVIHAPFGARVCKAWGLAMRKRFCRSFDFELQATADDDGFILSLGPQHSFPLESMFPLLTRENAKSLLEQAILQIPLFQLRWRWNMNRALLVLRMRNGKRVPPALQRFRSDDLLTAVFPKLTGCQENIVGDHEIPDHPLAQQTMHDCLTEALDIDGLHRVLEEIEAGRIELIARDTREPSPFCYELLNANPYAFLDGGEIQERRARAVSNRRTLNPDDVRNLATLDPTAIAQVVREAQPLIRNTDELHDVLLSRFFVPVAEFNSLPGQRWFETLANDGRATAIELPNGQIAWVPAERLPAVRVLFPNSSASPPIETPEGVRTNWESADARIALLRGWLEVCGPTTAEELAAQTTFDPELVFASLEALEGEGIVLRGRFRTLECGGSTPPLDQHGFRSDETIDADRHDKADASHNGQSTRMSEGGVEPPHSTVEWCHRRLLARIHRLTIEGLRRLIEPVDVATFWRYLARRHGVLLSDRRAGSNGVFEVVSMLQGLDISAIAWERDILPARVAEYRPEWLDELCLGGEVGWGRLYPPRIDPEKSKPMASVTRAVPVSLFLRGDLPWLDFVVQTANINDGNEASLSSSAADMASLLRSRGAMFLADLMRESQLLPTHVEDGLGELVSRGLVTADGFAGLRQLLSDASRSTSARGMSRRRPGLIRQRGATGSAGRWSLWRELPNTNHVDQPERASVLLGDQSSNEPDASAFRLMAAANNVSTGGLTPPRSPVNSATLKATGGPPITTALEKTEVTEQWAWQLLRRWGVVFKDLLARESGAPSWFDLLQVYRRLEARGEIRGGRFVAGVAGEQFSMSESIRQLRLLRDSGASQEMIVISAADPLNLVGVIDDLPRIPSIASHKLVYLDGHCVGTMIAEQAWLSPTLPEPQQLLVQQLLERGKAGDVAIATTPRPNPTPDRSTRGSKPTTDRVTPKLPRAGLERIRRVP